LLKSSDVIVVGGGVIGRAVAFRLTRDGMTVGCVYPRGRFHGQASAAAGAMLGVFSEISAQDDTADRHRGAAHRWEARQRYAGWLADLSAESGQPIRRTDGLFVIANPVGEDDARELDAIHETAEAFGQRGERVPAREIPGLAPQTGFVAFDALFLPGEGTVDTGQLSAALDGALSRHPRVTLYADRASRVTLDEGGGVTVALESGASLSGAAVVLANGVEMPRLLYDSALGALHIPPIFSGRGVSLAVRTGVCFTHGIRTPNRTFACGLHVLPRGDGTVYIGATNRFSTMPDMEQAATLGEMNTLLTGAMQEINPALHHAELACVAVGHRPVTLDRLPVVGRTADPRVLIASGTYRNGILLAPLIADLIAEEIACTGTHAMHPFSPLREMELASTTDRGAWLRRVSERLVSTLLEPGGRLPNGRDKDLERYFHVTLSLLLDPHYDRDALVRKVERMIGRAPMDENIPLLFDLLARHDAARERTPS
jgi:glycine oxidase